MKRLDHLRQKLTEAESVARAADAAESYTAAVSAIRLAVDIRKAIDEATAKPAKIKPPKDRRAFLEWQFAQLAGEAKKYEGRDGQAFAAMHRALSQNRDALRALVAEEEAAGTQGTDAEMEAAIVETVRSWAEPRRARVLAALATTAGQGAQ